MLNRVKKFDLKSRYCSQIPDFLLIVPAESCLYQRILQNIRIFHKGRWAGSNWSGLLWSTWLPSLSCREKLRDPEQVWTCWIGVIDVYGGCSPWEILQLPEGFSNALRKGASSTQTNTLFFTTPIFLVDFWALWKEADKTVQQKW